MAARIATETLRTVEDLRRRLARIDGRGYKAYKTLQGAYDLGDFVLHLVHVQGDPFATPSRVHVWIPQRHAGFPEWSYGSEARAVGVAHLLARTFAEKARRISRPRGSGHSGRIEMDRPGQEVLPRTAVRLMAEGVEARFSIGLPAHGRRIAADEARALLLEDVPRVVRESLRFAAYDPETVRTFAEVNEDATWLRAQLPAWGLVAFVADGACLPRRSGVDERPLETGAVLFASPPSLRREVVLPSGRRLTGMGIPAGVTLIVGGGYHGKSTLLRALERGVYNHEPGDGREFVVTVPDAVKVRAEDGRSVAGVDLSPFIRNLPSGIDTRTFSTANASGSTSQAAAIQEALEVGTSLLLIDEDTAATNFMVRDRRMQRLVPGAQEPITPFIDRVRQLYETRGVSTILVVGSSGDFFDVADTVIKLHEYRVEDVTDAAREIARQLPSERMPAPDDPFRDPPVRRVPDPTSVSPQKGKRATYVRARGRETLQLGTAVIDLRAVEQLVHVAQTRAIGQALAYALRRYMDGRRTVPEIIAAVMEDIAREGLDVLDPKGLLDLAGFRAQELAAALNRLRTLRVRVESPV
ncbi:ABC-ATPase domain-containing protein [Rhodothermus marinus]|uniref:ABC-ATPase domain-containing protein n=1 Tax=Rhodothermus marinus TaxID=29549 RepID=UPI001374C643|nr:ABC-ATPase domain-containing protein [Rhodothermus marinus]